MPKKRDHDTTDYQPPPLAASPGAEALVTVETQREQDLFSGKLAQRTFVKLYVAARESGLLADISDRDWKTLCTLATYMDGDGYCYPSQAELARAMGCSRQMANERIKSLSAFRFKGQQVLLVVKEGRTGKGEWARNGYRVLPISRLRIYDSPESREQSASANDSADETETTVSRNLDTVSGGEATVSSFTVTVPLDTKKNQRKPDRDLSKFEESHDKEDKSGTEHQRGSHVDANSREQRDDPIGGESRLVPLGDVARLRAVAATAIGGPTGPAVPPTTLTAPAPRRGRGAGSVEERELLAAYLADFVVQLGDEAPLSSTVTRTLKILKQASVPRQRWPDLLYEAKSITWEHSAQITKKPSDPSKTASARVRIPYYLAVLESLVGVRPAFSPTSDSAIDR